MTIEKIKITSKDQWLALREKDITSTEISVLFGCNPYKKEIIKNEKLLEIVDKDIKLPSQIKWGTRLEPVVAQGIAEDRNLTIEKFDYYYRDPDLRLGASFDYLVKWPGGDKLLEIKCVSEFTFNNNWYKLVNNKKVHVIPQHIFLQVQQQMLLTGIEECHIGVLVCGNRVRIFDVKSDAAVHEQIREKVSKYWRNLEIQ
ncbi:COG5377 Phage-related protein, predicted endonuclease [uncultured Caudovirales phage]|uniref:COG5377 Phage-related protein, predicted endonuclease n=1 Tax=uncultured Caudovirales phage TaxID=2100421 RepID=A0A6J5KVW5_9CAUD|nr:COG5377 Phage-related protein, predicted endonuclease [uncultured Caudovirales phage]